MKYSKEIIQFVNGLVSHYATYSTRNDSYSLDIHDVADFDLNELASLIMASDEAYASEATGFDNPNYEKTMLPALIKFMKNSSNDQTYEFNEAWTNGIVDYFSKPIQELINEQCKYHLHSINNEKRFYARKDQQTGENYWSRTT